FGSLPSVTSGTGVTPVQLESKLYRIVPVSAGAPATPLVGNRRRPDSCTNRYQCGSARSTSGGAVFGLIIPGVPAPLNPLAFANVAGDGSGFAGVFTTFTPAPSHTNPSNMRAPAGSAGTLCRGSVGIVANGTPTTPPTTLPTMDVGSTRSRLTRASLPAKFGP